MQKWQRIMNDNFEMYDSLADTPPILQYHLREQRIKGAFRFPIMGEPAPPNPPPLFIPIFYQLKPT